MATNRLIGSKECFFRPEDGGVAIALHGAMQTITDTLRPRLAIHEYLKVDGAEVEFMGQSPNTYKLLLHFVGLNWRRNYQNLAARINKTPKGLLVHPVFGNRRVACTGIDGASVDVMQATNAIQIPISFTDDSVATRLESDTARPVSEQKSLLDSAMDMFVEAAGPYTSLGGVFGGVNIATIIDLVVSTAATYGDAASSASDSNAADPALETQLESVGVACDNAIAAIEASAANTGNASAYPAVSATMAVYAAALDLQAAIEAARPPVIVYTVGADTNVMALASLLYGPQAKSRISEMLLLNPTLDAYNIRSGTQLRLSTPTLV